MLAKSSFFEIGTLAMGNELFGAAFSVEGDSKAVRLIADLLDEVQDWRVVVENDGLIFLTENVKNFFFLRDAGERLIDNLQRVERLGRGVKLADSSVDENQAGQRFLLFLQAAIAAGYGFTHAREVVVFRIGSSVSGLVPAPCFPANYKFSIVGLFHVAVFPDDHGRDRIRSLDVRDVEALDAMRFFRKIQRILQRFADGFRARLHHAEPLFERVLGVAFH